MARKGYGRNSTLVNITTHADDGTSPVGSNEWNENPNTDGVLGLTKSTQAISSNDIDVTDSYIEVSNAGDIYTLSAVTTSLSSTNYASDSASSISEGDLIYIVKAAGVGTVNLIHQYNSSGGAGKITTLTGESKALSATVPTILMARTISSALEWVEYGGGAVADASIDNTKLAVMAANTIKVRNANSSGAPSDIALANTQILIGDGTGFTAAALSGDVTMDNAGAVTVGTLNQSTTGSAATLTTPRAIGGVNFDGSTDINLPGVNAAGNQATSGLAATATLAAEATNVTAVANNSTNETVYPTFVDGATGTQGLETDTGLNYNPSTGLLSAVGLTLSGDLTVNGTNTIVNTTTLTVEDPLIKLASGNNAADSVDVGFYGLYDVGGTDKYAGIVRDASDSGKFIAFKDLQTEPTTTVDKSATGYTKAIIVADIEGDVTGTVTGNASGLSSTLAVASGGTNLTSYTAGDILYATGTTTLAKLPKGTGSQTLKMNTGATAPEWVTVAGAGATTLHKYTASNQTTVFTVSANSIAYDVGTTVASQAAGVGQREIYIRKIDANNEGVFTIIHKNGALVEVQIAQVE